MDPFTSDAVDDISDDVITAHLLPIPNQPDGVPTSLQTPCWALIGLSGPQLRQLEERGPKPSLRACGFHDLDTSR